MIEDGVLEGFDPNLLIINRQAEQIAATAGLGRRVIALGISSAISG